MIKFVCAILLLTLSLRVHATFQAPERLFYQGDTLKLLAEPLWKYSGLANISNRNMFERYDDGGFSTGCWRGYIGSWKIENDSLFLVALENDSYYSDEDIKKYNLRQSFADSCGIQYADLQRVFGAECRNGKVFAYWVSDSLLAGKGDIVHYVHDGYASSWATELDFHFKDGILKRVQVYDNTKTVNREDNEVIKSRADRQRDIDWEQVEYLGERKLKTSVSFRVNQLGDIDSVWVIRGCGVEKYDRMAMDWLKGKGGLSVIYKRGRIQRRAWTIPFEFSEAERKKYSSR